MINRKQRIINGVMNRHHFGNFSSILKPGHVTPKSMDGKATLESLYDISSWEGKCWTSWGDIIPRADYNQTILFA